IPVYFFKPLEHAFHEFQVSFIRDETGCFRLKLFDPTIRNTRLIDLINKKVLSAPQARTLRRSVSRAKLPCHFAFRTTFGDVDGKALAFTELN
ncbi:hypothetical protein F442_07839, partial [Phytophthora nicotianae P10297]